jgi:hypothetical protein
MATARGISRGQPGALPTTPGLLISLLAYRLFSLLVTPFAELASKTVFRATVRHHKSDSQSLALLPTSDGVLFSGDFIMEI